MCGSEQDNVNKIHLLSWEILCRPKERGGFGLRKAEGMNKSLLAKLGWRLVKNEDGLWARILRSKYGQQKNGPATFKYKQKAFQTRKGLEWASDLLCKGLIWKVVDGRRICFWKDCWIADEPLQQVGERTDTNNDEDALARDLWHEGRG